MRDETGASAVEYSIMVAGIAALIMLIAFTLGVHVGALFNSVPTF